MIEIHASVMRLFKMMYAPEELMRVVFTILADMAEMERTENQYPFMIIGFNGEPIMQAVEGEEVPESYIWN
ncbi:MAG: hypothetical protein ACYTEW_22650 [Planctomycetota bacterium]|jgi:hypothetical protein